MGREHEPRTTRATNMSMNERVNESYITARSKTDCFVGLMCECGWTLGAMNGQMDRQRPSPALYLYARCMGTTVVPSSHRRPARRDATKQFCRVGSGGVNLVWLSVRLRVLAKHLDDRRVVSMVRRGLRVGVGAKGWGLNE